jgi:hypothetical protein
MVYDHRAWSQAKGSEGPRRGCLLGWFDKVFGRSRSHQTQRKSSSEPFSRSSCCCALWQSSTLATPQLPLVMSATRSGFVSTLTDAARCSKGGIASVQSWIATNPSPTSVHHRLRHVYCGLTRHRRSERVETTRPHCALWFAAPLRSMHHSPQRPRSC